MNPLEHIPIEILSIILLMVVQGIKNISTIRCLSHRFDTIFEQHIKQFVFNVIDATLCAEYLKFESNCLYDTTTDLALHSTCTDADLIKFTKLRRLNNYQFSKITDKSLQCMTNLTHLKLFPTGITDECIKQLTKLQRLELNHNHRITDDSIKNLIHLDLLSLENNYLITDHGISTLTNLKCIGLINDDKITINGLRHLPKLAGLTLKNNGNISNEDVSQLKLESLLISTASKCKLTSDMTNLTSLYLMGHTTYTDDVLGKLTKLRQLTIVNDHLPLSAKTLSLLTNLNSLRCNEDDIRKHIGQLTHLTKLTRINR